MALPTHTNLGQQDQKLVKVIDQQLHKIVKKLGVKYSFKYNNRTNVSHAAEKALYEMQRTGQTFAQLLQQFAAIFSNYKKGNNKRYPHQHKMMHEPSELVLCVDTKTKRIETLYYFVSVCPVSGRQKRFY